MSTITVHGYRLGVDGSVSATGIAASAIDPSWSEVLSQPGEGSVTFKNDDPILQALHFDGCDLLQFRIDGVPEWVMWPDPAHIVSISQQETDGERTTLSGPGHLALVDRMRVYPGNGIGALPKPSDRFFGASTLDYVEGPDWSDSKEIMDVGTAKTSWGVTEPRWADDFPLDIAEVIWADNPGGNPSTSTGADLGSVWFRYPFTPPEEGIYRGFLTADNAATVMVDSVIVGSCDTFEQTTQFDFSLSDQPHIIYIEARNGPLLFSPVGSNPAGVALAIYEVTLAGLVLVTYTFSGYQALAYGDGPPVVTLGFAYGTFLDEGIARGVLPELGRDFDDTLDSNGNAWDEIADPATPVKTSGLDFTRQLAATYADFRMAPDLSAGLVLQAYRLGEMEGSSGVTLTRGGNITSLEHNREGQAITDLLIEGAERWLERGDAGARALYGRFESSLDAGSPFSDAEVYRIADGQLDVFAHPREEISAGAHGATVIRVGQTVIVPDSTGTAQAERCVGRTVTQNEKSRQAIFTYAFRDVILGETERIINIAKAS